jgi:hypothetical protein
MLFLRAELGLLLLALDSRRRRRCFLLLFGADFLLCWCWTRFGAAGGDDGG